MKVYRVEHPSNSTGPYQSGAHYGLSGYREIHNAMINAHCNHVNDHPTPGYENLQVEGRVCGCKTLKSLKAWFGDFLPKLIQLGFIIKEFDLPEDAVCCGLKQVTFDASRATDSRVIRLRNSRNKSFQKKA